VIRSLGEDLDIEVDRALPEGFFINVDSWVVRE